MARAWVTAVILENGNTHPVPVCAIGDGVDGAGQNDAALVAVCCALPILHDLHPTKHFKKLSRGRLTAPHLILSDASACMGFVNRSVPTGALPKFAS